MANDDGTPGRIDRSGLEPGLRAKLEADDLVPPQTPEELTPTARRASAERDLPALWGSQEPVAAIDDILVETPEARLRARIYRPAGGGKGTVFFLHGGGWALGSLDTHDRPTRMLANLVPCNVVSLEYRKSPEHPFPAAVRDVDRGLDWLLREGGAHGLDTSRIVIAGESAGGNLAAVGARRARDRGIPLAGQALIYPVTDTSMDTPSYGAYAAGFFLTAETMAWFVEQYFAPGDDRLHPDAAPLRAAGLARLPPAFVVTAEYDPLRDEGRAYAARLVEAGNDVTYVEWPGVIHGFWMMHGITPETAAVIRTCSAWIGDRFAPARA